MSSSSAAVLQANNEFNQALSQKKGGVLDKDSFLLLLVTQFKYQDPLNPMDDKEFVAQMSQFSSLEQLMNLNTGMESLTQATTNQQLINATSYIGKQVTVSGNTVGKVTDGATGTAAITRFRYSPQDNVAYGVIRVVDPSNPGNVIYEENIESKQMGTTYEFNWNGKSLNGATAADGVYSISLELFNAKGEAVLSDQVVDATVTGVVNDKGTVYLGLEGGQLMPLANVRQVMQPKTVAADTKDPQNGSGSGGTGDTGSGGTEGTGGTGDAGTGGTEGTGGTGDTADGEGGGQETGQAA